MSSASNETTWQIAPEADGERLDRHLAARFEITRSRAQRWIKEGHVSVDGSSSKAAHVLRAGQALRCSAPADRDDDRIEPEDRPVTVLFEDERWLVVDKPAGLTVHPGAGRSTGTLAHRALFHYPELAGVGGPGRPGIVHRLDKDTSGVMVLARTDESYRALQQAFESRAVVKEYLALCHGRFPEPRGTIDRPIGRHPQRRKEMTVRRDGRPAQTEYEALDEASGITLLRLRIHTGRTHQIRVHLKAIRHPIVGDPIYGEARWKEAPPPVRRRVREFPRPALHAWRLGLPGRADEIERFEAPLAPDLAELWADLGGEPLDRLL